MKNSILTILFIMIAGVFPNSTSETTNSKIKQNFTSMRQETTSLVNIEPIDTFNYSSVHYSLKNFDYVGECVLSNSLSEDTLTIELLSKNLQFSKLHIEFVFNNDTLNITRVPETIHKDTVIYNKDKNSYDTLHLVEMISGEIGLLDSKYKLETFRFFKQRKCPKTICVNGELYRNCPTKDIEYKTYNGKIVNRINKDGFKDGIWFKFHENGKIKEEKHYDNGIFLGGKTFDKNGKDLHSISESSGGIEYAQ